MKRRNKVDQLPYKRSFWIYRLRTETFFPFEKLRDSRENDCEKSCNFFYDEVIMFTLSLEMIRQIKDLVLALSYLWRGKDECEVQILLCVSKNLLSPINCQDFSEPNLIPKWGPDSYITANIIPLNFQVEISNSTSVSVFVFNGPKKWWVKKQVFFIYDVKEVFGILCLDNQKLFCDFNLRLLNLAIFLFLLVFTTYFAIKCEDPGHKDLKFQLNIVSENIFKYKTIIKVLKVKQTRNISFYNKGSLQLGCGYGVQSFETKKYFFSL